MQTNVILPQQLTDYHFRIVKARGKAPNVETAWQTVNNYLVEPHIIHAILKSGLNYGFTVPSGFACFIDADTQEIQDVLDKELFTFRYSSGTVGHFQYVYFIKDGIGCIPLVHGAYIKGKGGFAVGPGSIHPNGRMYGIDIRDTDILVTTRDTLINTLRPYLLKKENHTGKSFTLSPTKASKVTIEKTASEFLELWNNADGMRHNLTLALTGYLERRGWLESDITSVLITLVKDTGKGHEHISQVHYAYGNKERKYGLPTILSIEEVIKNVHKR